MPASRGSEAVTGRCVCSCTTARSAHAGRKLRPRAPGLFVIPVRELWHVWGREGVGYVGPDAKIPVRSASGRAGERPPQGAYLRRPSLYTGPSLFGSEAASDRRPALSPGVSCCVLTIEALLRSECEQQATAPAAHKTAFTATLRHERTLDDPATQRDTDR